MCTFRDNYFSLTHNLELNVFAMSRVLLSSNELLWLKIVIKVILRKGLKHERNSRKK